MVKISIIKMIDIVLTKATNTVSTHVMSTASINCYSKIYYYIFHTVFLGIILILIIIIIICHYYVNQK